MAWFVPLCYHVLNVQVLSLWEDAFTGVFMFRARWLVHASDLPADVLSRLRTTRQVAESDRGATGSKKPVAKDQDGADEVFLTNRVEDVEVRSVVKPITLCVSSSGTTAVSPERNHKMGPRLTHAYFAASGDFRPLESTDPLLKRARVRQANAVALAFRADQEHEAAKSGKPIVKSNGWLLPKRRAFERRGAQTAARGGGGDVEIAAPSLKCAGSHEISTSPIVDIEDESDDCGTDAPSNPEDGEWKEGDDEDASDSNSDRPKKSQPTLSGGESFTKRKSPRQRKSQLSPAPDAKADNCSEANPEANTTTPNFQRRRRVPFKKRQVPLPPRPRRLAIPTMAEEPVIAHVCKASPPASAEFSMAAKAVRPVRTRISIGLEPQSSVPLPRSSSMEDVGKASPRQYISTKRKRSVPSEATKGANRSHHPPLRTLVGKDRQTDIPDLLSAAERKRPHTGTGAKMVGDKYSSMFNFSCGIVLEVEALYIAESQSSLNISGCVLELMAAPTNATLLSIIRARFAKIAQSRDKCPLRIGTGSQAKINLFPPIIQFDFPCH